MNPPGGIGEVGGERGRDDASPCSHRPHERLEQGDAAADHPAETGQRDMDDHLVAGPDTEFCQVGGEVVDAEGPRRVGGGGRMDHGSATAAFSR